MIFEVTPEHIEALSDSDLRTLVGYLAEQETVRAGHSPSSVTYGGHQNVKDGGVDVRVDLKAVLSPGISRALSPVFKLKLRICQQARFSRRCVHAANFAPRS